MSESASSLRDLDRVEDRIRQHRQVERTVAIVIVEGSGDATILEPLLPKAHFFPADGKSNALRASGRLRDWGVGGFTTVVDRDFDSSNELDALGEIVYPYACRDLEGMLISIGALHVVLRHQGSSNKLQRLGGVDKLVADLLSMIAPVTRLRGASRRNNWGLAFDAVKLHTKIDASTLEFNVHAYCASLISQSDTSADLGLLKKAAIDATGDDEPLDPRGKDVVAAAGVALRRLAASLPSAVCEESVLTAQLHSSSGLALSQSTWLAGLRGRLVQN